MQPKNLTPGIVNPHNYISRELSKVRLGKVLKRSTAHLYEAYLAHPTAQYTMTFAEYKRKHKRSRKRK